MENNSRDRPLHVFFYGLYMDAQVLASKGVSAASPVAAYVPDHVVKLGSKAMMLRSPGGRCHGMVFAMTHAEVDKLYAGMDDYRAEAFLAVPLEGGAPIAAVSMVHVDPPIESAEDPAYAVPFRALLARLGLPAV
jgi:hypothetical protein